MSKHIIIKSREDCKAHYWLIDSHDVGHCKYCPAVCDFGKMQREEHKKEVSKRLAAIASDTHKTGRPRGRKKKVRRRI